MGVLSIVRIPEKVLGKVVLEAVDRAVETRWDAAIARADRVPGGPRAFRVTSATKAFTRELAALGAASGGIAAVPGAGTGTALATAAGEVSLYTMRLADLVLTIAALHGHRDADPEQRRAWVLSVLALGEGASVGLAALAGGVGRGSGGGTLAGLPAPTIAAVNRRLAAKLLTRYGTRRGLAALGKLVPLGVGAVIGAGANSAGVQAVARHADRFFRDTAPAPDAA